jgi:hypothetical protein
MSRGRLGGGARIGAFLIAAALVAVPLAGVAAADHGARTLDLAPERENSDIGTKRPIKAMLSSAPDPGTSVTVSFDVSGAHSTSGSCTVVGGTVDEPNTTTNESTTCVWSYRGTQVGDDVVRGWIADTVPDQDEGPSAATPEERNNATDVVTTLWFDGLSSSTTLDCSPESASAAVGSTATVLECAAIRQSTSAGVAGVRIDGENLGGANDGDATDTVPVDYDDACVTGSSGRCRIAIPDTFEAGSAHICFWADEDDDTGYHATSEWDGGRCDEGLADSAANLNTTDVVAMAWRYDRSVTAGASAGRATYGDRVTLAGEVSSAGSGCAVGVDVAIRRTLSGGAQQIVGTVKTGAAGGYSLNLKADRGARYSALVDADTSCGADRSSPVSVLVRKKVGIAAKARVVRGRMVAVRTSLAPCGDLAGQRVVLYQSTNGGRTFQRVAAKETNGDCVAVFKRRVRQRVVFQARSPQQDPEFLAGASPRKLVTIRR